MLSATLAHIPSLWDESVSYNGIRYHLTSLEKYSSEYQNVSRHFLGRQIKLIERVQHPYAYGRFLLKKDQLKILGLSIQQKTLFHQIDEKDKAVALEYNCDSRRYSANVSTKPTFNATPYGIGKMFIILEELNYHQQDSDANYYPTYVVELE